jgi:hypothetical protein
MRLMNLGWRFRGELMQIKFVREGMRIEGRARQLVPKILERGRLRIELRCHFANVSRVVPVGNAGACRYRKPHSHESS